MQGKRWQKLLSHEHEQRLKLEDMVEQLAKDQISLEKKARMTVKHDGKRGGTALSLFFAWLVRWSSWPRPDLPGGEGKLNDQAWWLWCLCGWLGG